jgi:uncharacterized protein YbjT (DUF2867 family)
MTTVLVTGATGSVGSAVVRELGERRVGVRAFVRDPDRAAAILGDDVELAVGDFDEPASPAATCPTRSATRRPRSTPPRPRA